MFSKHVDVISVAGGIILASVTGSFEVVQDQVVVITAALQGIAGLVGAFVFGLPDKFRKALGE